MKNKEREPDIVIEIPLKKKGWPLLLGKRLDDQVQEYIFEATWVWVYC